MKTAKRGGGLRRLQAIFDDLPDVERRTLLEFAEFLASRTPKKAVPPQEPVPHERPVQESVVKAMRRLSATYPMLDKAKILNETSALMAQHVMQGRAAAEVIDDLEALFEVHFRRYSEARDTDVSEAPGQE